MIQTIPLTSDPNQTFQVTMQVDGQNLTLGFELHYNEMAGYWVMTIKDSQNNVLIDCVPLITGDYPMGNLLEQHAYLRIGAAVIVPVGGFVDDWPDDTNLGTDFLLLWGDSPT